MSLLLRSDIVSLSPLSRPCFSRGHKTLRGNVSIYNILAERSFVLHNQLIQNTGHIQTASTPPTNRNGHYSMSRAPPDKWQSGSSQDLLYRHLGAIIEIHHCAIHQLYLSLETIYPCFAAATLTSPRIIGINLIPMYWRAILLLLSSFNEHLLHEMNQLQSKAPIILAHHYFDRSFWSLECRVHFLPFLFLLFTLYIRVVQ